jgi:hypothetical protein
MRLIRRLVLLAIVGAGGIAVYDWVDNHWPLQSRAAAREAAHVTQEAVPLGNRVAAKASVAATKVGDKMTAVALTAKITSKMALDDHANG